MDRGALPAYVIQGISAVLAWLHLNRDLRVLHHWGVPPRQQSQDGKVVRFQTNVIVANWARHLPPSTWVPLRLRRGSC